MDLCHRGYKEQYPPSPDRGSAFSPPPPPRQTLTASPIPHQAQAEAIGNKDNSIKQPFEIPLRFRRSAAASGLGCVVGWTHGFALFSGKRDVTALSSRLRPGGPITAHVSRCRALPIAVFSNTDEADETAPCQRKLRKKLDLKHFAGY